MLARAFPLRSQARILVLVTAPYGVGIHPYLTCNLTPVDDYLFQLPAEQVYAVDEHANPTTLHHVDELNLNFTRATKIAATKIDHTFKTANDLWEMNHYPSTAFAFGEPLFRSTLGTNL